MRDIYDILMMMIMMMTMIDRTRIQLLSRSKVINSLSILGFDTHAEPREETKSR